MQRWEHKTRVRGLQWNSWVLHSWSQMVIAELSGLPFALGPDEPSLRGLSFSKAVKDGHLTVHEKFVLLVTFRKAFPLTAWNPPWSNLSPLFSLSFWRCRWKEHRSVLTSSPLLPELKQPTVFWIFIIFIPFLRTYANCPTLFLKWPKPGSQLSTEESTGCSPHLGGWSTHL